jgi:predicted enzyme related to lactoylglutathione lyase
MDARDNYLPGVPCWIDLEQPDLERTKAFYGSLFGWEFEVRTPPQAPTQYAYARLDGLIVGGVGGPPSSPDAGTSGWTSYVAVTSADEAAAAVTANGGRVTDGPVDIPRSGRVARCEDPHGAVFGLWQASELKGSQLVNAPGSWNFSDLVTADAKGASEFYGAVFGWESDALDMGGGGTTGMLRLPGYGDFLVQRDPELRERQETNDAPGGFADAVALLTPADEPGVRARWGAIFAVADADASFAKAIELGAEIVTPLFDTQYTRMGAVRDPQGAELTLSEYRPPAGA